MDEEEWALAQAQTEEFDWEAEYAAEMEIEAEIEEKPVDKGAGGPNAAGGSSNAAAKESAPIDFDKEFAPIPSYMSKPAEARPKEKKAEKTARPVTDFILERPPEDTDSVSCILGNGQRVFFSTEAASVSEERSKAAHKQLRPNGSGMLLQRSMKDILQSIDEKKRREYVESEGTMEIEAAPSPKVKSGGKANRLWVDTYKPEKFSQLLSDEKTNREVLSWMKEWDPLSFPNAQKSKAASSAAMISPLMQKPQVAEAAGMSISKKALRPTKDSMLLMLCGPPGSGKTTLAHIVARHAGYEPMEINASDDRSPKVLRERIIAAMESKAVFGSGKPRCIILDEIDGAIGGGEGKGLAGVLTELCSCPLSARERKGDDDDGSPIKKKRGGKNHHPVTRPIICICNDFYAAALRPLRPFARVHTFAKASGRRLVDRLKIICRREQLQVPAHTLRAVVEGTDNDIRACLHSLQFLRPGMKGGATAAAIGRKDVGKNIFEIWNEAYAAPKRQSKARPLIGAAAHADGDPIGADASTSGALQAPGSFLSMTKAHFDSGQHDKIIEGIYHNLGRTHFSDPSMDKLNTMHEWLGASDLFAHEIRAKQAFHLTPFLPLVTCAAHQLIGAQAIGRPQITYPRQEGQLRMERAQNMNVLQTFLEGLDLHTSGRDARQVVCNMLTPLMTILAPTLREVSVSLFSPEEKCTMERLVEVLSACKLNFIPASRNHFQRNSDDKFGQNNARLFADGFELEPPVHLLVRFSDGGWQESRKLGPELKKLVAHEVNLESMRKVSGGGMMIEEGEPDDKTNDADDPMQTEDKGKGKEGGSPTDSSAKKRDRDAAGALATTVSTSEAAKAAALKAAAKDVSGVSWLSTGNSARNKRARKQTAAGRGKKSNVAYKFKFQAGYTNAVKRTVHVRDFLE
jgi:chromosome transmission fidelity protein 18